MREEMQQEGDTVMNSGDIRIIEATYDEVAVNPCELALRLHTERGYVDEHILRCMDMLRRTAHYKCVYIRTDVDLSRNGQCDFGFMNIHSKHLYTNLNQCRQAFVMALTIGRDVDRLLQRLNITSQADHFIADGIASAAIESFCDYASDIMKADLNCAPRFSPGYGDVSIEYQKPLLERLHAARLLGITLNQAYFMTPSKSITAIMGIQNE